MLLLLISLVEVSRLPRMQHIVQVGEVVDEILLLAIISLWGLRAHGSLAGRDRAAKLEALLPFVGRDDWCFPLLHHGDASVCSKVTQVAVTSLRDRIAVEAS